MKYLLSICTNQLVPLHLPWVVGDDIKCLHARKYTKLVVAEDKSLRIPRIFIHN